MALDLTGIQNQNEYYTNHYFLSIFSDNAQDTIKRWRQESRESRNFQKEGSDGDERTPWSLLREAGRQYFVLKDRFRRERRLRAQAQLTAEWTRVLLQALGYDCPAQDTGSIVHDELELPVQMELLKANGAPQWWAIPSVALEDGEELLQQRPLPASLWYSDNGELPTLAEYGSTYEDVLSEVFFQMAEPPRWILLVGMDQVALVDRSKWNEKRCLVFELDDIFGRREETTLQAMAVLLHRESLVPEEGNSLLDQLDENSHRHASSVSQDLKYALREAIELLGNEVIHDKRYRLKEGIYDKKLADQLTSECLRYMYRILFLLFIEARPELGYAPMKSQVYVEGYSLEGLRDVVDQVQEESDEVGEGFFLHETLTKLFSIVYDGYPKQRGELDSLLATDVKEEQSLSFLFTMDPLKAHIFDDDYTPHIKRAKLRNKVLLKIIDLMSISRGGNGRQRRGRISYAALGINQLGAVYEALLSYRGFFAEEDLYEVKRAGDKTDELNVGYFVPERELDNYEEEERVRYTEGPNEGKLRVYPRGTFIYRLAGREREKSASYYTPEVLTQSLVKYALKELLADKTADQILALTICEPAMGSAAFLNEAVNQLAEAYLTKKQEETGQMVSYEHRLEELQKVKMYIADRNVYGIDLNPIAVELAEVSLWLNTIYQGAYVPWFGSQLVCGNSLIGARRQVYTSKQLQAKGATMVWHKNAPERIQPGQERDGKKQVYHFLVGDPGMCSYTDKVIKTLAADELKKIKAWNKEFIRPLEKSEVQTMLNLSQIIDELWQLQTDLRRQVRQDTSDPLSVFGHQEQDGKRRTTIREKDLVFANAYKSEHGENAGPYARLKLAMDYWCALWFWPINEAEELPTREEFLFEMSLILEGGIISVQPKGQLSLFDNELEQEIIEKYSHLNTVNLDILKQQNRRLRLVEEIATRHRFLHWELEFADVFADRGGFDLVVGNPPWVLVGWNEQAAMSDMQPLFAVKKFSAAKVAKLRDETLKNDAVRNLYLDEYQELAGMQNFLNAIQNYPDLVGMKANLYKCFLPQAWTFCGSEGVSAFVHPEGVFNDPRGTILRRRIFQRLCRLYQFENELNLFEGTNDHGRMRFTLSVYRNGRTELSFEAMFNVFWPKTIDDSYEPKDHGGRPVPGIKSEDHQWNTTGHPDRILQIGEPELVLFSGLVDTEVALGETRILGLHSKQLLGVLGLFSNISPQVTDLGKTVSSTQMLNETNAQNDGIITRQVGFSKRISRFVLSGPHVGVANPLFKASRRVCMSNSDYDNIDLSSVDPDYLPRVNYEVTDDEVQYRKALPKTPWGTMYTDHYRLLSRKMLNIAGERTLISAIVPPGMGHIDGLFGVTFRDQRCLSLVAGVGSSLPADFMIKVMGKPNLRPDYFGKLPILTGTPQEQAIIFRALLLNCLTKYYAPLWEEVFQPEMVNDGWAKGDPRLRPERFSSLTSEWKWDVPLRTDYERRQALIELDVLVAMALGMTLEQLQTIYRIQFPVLRQYEQGTWYDRNGRIVKTNNRSLTNVGYGSSKEEKQIWEEIKDATAGTFERVIEDDTMPGGPVERTITYEAPFDQCSREEDYAVVWAHFARQFGLNKE